MICVLTWAFLLAQDVDLKKRVATLVEQLTDPAIDVREDAARELKSLHKDERVPAWLDAAGTAEARGIAAWIRVRREAPDALIERHPKLVDDWLAADANGRLVILEGLPKDARGFIGTMASAAALDAPRKQRLVALLESIERADHPVIAELLDDASTEVAERAAKTLARANRGIARLLEDARLSVRLAAIGEAPPTRDNLARIATLLSHDERRVRSAAASRLGEECAHADDVVKLLSDADRGVREQAIRALGLMRAVAHADAIARELRGTDVLHQHAALYALGRMRAKAHAETVAAFLDGDWQHHVVEAARTLCAMDAREHAPALRKLLKLDAEVARAAAITLARWGDADAAAYLVDKLRTFEVEDRVEASLSLSAFRDPDAWKELERASEKGGAFGRLTNVGEDIEKRSGLKVRNTCGHLALWMDGDVRLTDLLTTNNAMVVVEQGRISFLTVEEGLAFWKEWWKERK